MRLFSLNDDEIEIGNDRTINIVLIFRYNEKECFKF